MAFLAGSYIASNVVLKGEKHHPNSESVLYQLNLAHILTPISNFISIWATMNDYNVLSRVLDTFSIF
jgi:hypothetical protein